MFLYNLASRVIVPTSESTLAFSLILHHATYHMPQTKYTYAECLTFTLHFLKKSLILIRVYAKTEVATILPHQVSHPILIKVTKGIKKALSEQRHNLVLFTFLCSSEFTNPLIKWLHTC